MLKVLMVVPKYPYPVVGGLEKQAHELAKALANININVEVLSSRFGPKHRSYSKVEGISVHRHYWSESKAVRFIVLPFVIFLLFFRLVRKADVVHLHQHSWIGLYIILLSKFLHKPILTKMPSIGLGEYPTNSKMFLSHFRQNIIMHSNATIAMSMESMNELLQAGYNKENILLTPNGIDIKAVPFKTYTTKLSPKVVFLGRLTDVKRVNVIISAWFEVCEDNSHDALLEIWGSGPMKNSLVKQAKLLNLEDRIIFRGFINNVTEKLVETDIFALSSLREGNPNAVLEAMAVGLPVVSTRVGGVPMLVGKEGEDLLYDLDDHSALSRILLMLIKDQKKRIDKGRAMRRRVEKYFDINMIANTYAKAYALLKLSQDNDIYKISNPVICDWNKH